MTFMISKSQQSFSEAKEEVVNNHPEGGGKAEVTTCLHLKSSSAHKSQPLDKDVVLRRIRHHKCLNKIKTTFQSLLGSSSESDGVAAHQQTWMEQNDAFSAP